MKQYRLPFFNALADLLAADGITLHVVYGTPWAAEQRRADHADLPLLTTDLPFHSPEIEYLEPGRNGLMTAPEATAFAEAISGLLADSGRLQALRAGAAASSQRYSIAAMAGNFATGVRQCLRRF